MSEGSVPKNQQQTSANEAREKKSRSKAMKGNVRGWSGMSPPVLRRRWRR